MKNYHLAILIFVLLSFASGVTAQSEPRSSTTDPRIKVVRYSQNQVVNIVASPFIGTVIQFLPDETIMQPIGFGDPEAWDAQLLSPRDLQISPIVDQPSTNMTVRTDKRYHYFSLTANEGGAGDATFTVRIVDPAIDELARRGRETVVTSNDGWTINYAPSDTTSIPAPIAHLYEPAPAEMWHFKYRIRGDEDDIGIDQVFDNGVKTFFSFKKDSSIPALFVRRGNEESLVMAVPSPEGYQIALTVADEWVLRRGRSQVRIHRQR